MTAMGAISNRCPCCSATLSSCDKPTVDLDTNTLFFHGQALLLTPSQAEIALLLVERSPGVVSYEALANGVYGFAGNSANEIGTIHVMIARMRQMFKTVGLAIKNHRARGFSVARMEETA